MKNKNKEIIRSTISIYIILFALLIFFGGMIIINSRNNNVEQIKPTNFGYHEIEVENYKSTKDFLDETSYLFKTKYIDLGEFRLTSYCSCPICCGVWSGGPTYSGVMPTANHTIAVDPDVIPLGTKVKIDGFDDIIFVAEDTGSAINENHIDIYCDTHEECFNAIYNRYAEVYVVEES